MTMSTNTSLGIDIAKNTFVAVLWFAHDRHTKREFTNNQSGFKQLKVWLAQHLAGSVRAGIEATNVYSEALCEWLAKCGHIVHLLNPERVAHYARSKGHGNKTDPADGLLIAEYVARHPELRVWHAPSAEQKDLRSLMRARAQLVQCRMRLQNEVDTAQSMGRQHLLAAVEAVSTQIAAVEREARKHIKAHPLLQRQLERLMTCKSIGFVTAAVALAELPDITPETNPRSITKWSGLNPRRYQSGQLELRTRISRKGNQYLRNALYMPALVAKRSNPIIRDFADRLKAKGKSSNAILGAISHKLLRIMVGMLKSNTDFDANFAQKNI